MIELTRNMFYTYYMILNTSCLFIMLPTLKIQIGVCISISVVHLLSLLLTNISYVDLTVYDLMVSLFFLLITTALFCGIIHKLRPEVKREVIKEVLTPDETDVNF